MERKTNNWIEVMQQKKNPHEKFRTLDFLWHVNDLFCVLFVNDKVNDEVREEKKKENNNHFQGLLIYLFLLRSMTESNFVHLTTLQTIRLNDKQNSHPLVGGLDKVLFDICIKQRSFVLTENLLIILS